MAFVAVPTEVDLEKLSSQSASASIHKEKLSGGDAEEMIVTVDSRSEERRVGKEC